MVLDPAGGSLRVDAAIGDIRRAMRELLARFPDEYWADVDGREQFPWDFYEVVAAGGLAGHRDP